MLVHFLSSSAPLASFSCLWCMEGAGTAVTVIIWLSSNILTICFLCYNSWVLSAVWVKCQSQFCRCFCTLYCKEGMRSPDLKSQGKNFRNLFLLGQNHDPGLLVTPWISSLGTSSLSLPSLNSLKITHFFFLTCITSTCRSQISDHSHYWRDLPWQEYFSLSPFCPCCPCYVAPSFHLSVLGSHVASFCSLEVMSTVLGLLWLLSERGKERRT